MTLDIDALGGPNGPRAQFPADITQLWIEIGFGGGEHLAWQAENNPTVGIIGCEPFINGMASLLAKLPEAQRPYVRLHGDDGLPILRRLPEASLDRIIILFPDPWPKQKHAGRRFVRQESMPEILRTLKPGGELRFASDDPTMINWALMHLNQERRLVWQAKGSADWLNRPDDWPATRYEEKARQAGRQPVFLRYIRGDA